MANPTVLDALTLGRVVYITNSAVISTTGLHLRQGNATDGGAVFMGDGGLIMTQTLVYSNTAINGGALYNASGQVTLDSNDLRDNQATNGGAFYHAGGTSLLQNNIIRNNTATDGGGIYNASSGLTVWHNTLYANSATNGGGFYTTDSSPNLVNNVFANNTATTGHAIYSTVSYTPDYNDTDPAANAYGGSASAGPNSLSVDPLFVDAPSGDFHLQDNSPVIDRGDPAMTLVYDFEGDLRPGGQGFDMGIDEIPGCRARILREPGIIYGNVQLAVDHSIPGDVVEVTSDRECRGVHPFDTGTQIISQTVHITHNLTLVGGYNSDFGSVTGQTVLNPVTQGRAMLITDTAVVTIGNFLLTNGQATGLGGGPAGGDAGGGLYYHGSGGMISNTTFYSNTAEYGSGLFNAGGGLTLTNSAVWSNTATFEGGGIYNDSDAMGLVGNEIYQNLAQRGGGIYNDTGLMILETNEVHHNSVVNGGAGLGGGFYNNNSASTLDLGNRFYNKRFRSGWWGHLQQRWQSDRLEHADLLQYHRQRRGRHLRCWQQQHSA